MDFVEVLEGHSHLSYHRVCSGQVHAADLVALERIDEALGYTRGIRADSRPQTFRHADPERGRADAAACRSHSGQTKDLSRAGLEFQRALRVVRAELAISVVPVRGGATLHRCYGLRVIPLADDWATRRFAICFRDAERCHSPPACWSYTCA